MESMLYAEIDEGNYKEVAQAILKQFYWESRGAPALTEDAKRLASLMLEIKRLGARPCQEMIAPYFRIREVLSSYRKEAIKHVDALLFKAPTAGNRLHTVALFFDSLKNHKQVLEKLKNWEFTTIYVLAAKGLPFREKISFIMSVPPAVRHHGTLALLYTKFPELTNNPTPRHGHDIGKIDHVIEEDSAPIVRRDINSWKAPGDANFNYALQRAINDFDEYLKKSKDIDTVMNLCQAACTYWFSLATASKVAPTEENINMFGPIWERKVKLFMHLVQMSHYFSNFEFMNRSYGSVCQEVWKRYRGEKMKCLLTPSYPELKAKFNKLEEEAMMKYAGEKSA